MSVSLPSFPLWIAILDILMVPIMYIARGNKNESLQETHGWHIVSRPHSRNEQRTQTIMGKDPSPYSSAGGFFRNWGLFHIPWLGGWTHSTVLSVGDYSSPWYIGWANTDETVIHRMPIKNVKIKVLDGKSVTQFFAYSMEGGQIPLYVVGQGILGDGQYVGVSLR